MKTYKHYNESFIEENAPSEFKDNNYQIKHQDENGEKVPVALISIDIKIDENNSKKFEINSFDELDNKLNAFCEENKLSETAKKYIYDSMMEKMNQNKNECKTILYIII